MTISLRERAIDAVVLDIEGTTTPISFVYDVLFPYARANLREYLSNPDPDHGELRAALDMLDAERRRDLADGHAPPAAMADYCEWLMERDRKSRGLKLIQGLIWAGGYQSEVFKGQVFPDVPPALTRWKAAGVDVAIYSSGSTYAQHLLFANSEFGDLTSLITDYYDTSVGPKVNAESYRGIARALGLLPKTLLFISDVGAELEAAEKAGLQVALSVRPGNAEQRVRADVPVIRSFDELEV